MFSSPIPLMEINSSEICAIHIALKISMSSDLIRNHHLIIESDSTNALKWSNDKPRDTWNLRFLLNFIRNASLNGLHIAISHKYCASYSVVDGSRGVTGPRKEQTDRPKSGNFVKRDWNFSRLVRY